MQQELVISLRLIQNMVYFLLRFTSGLLDNVCVKSVVQTTALLLLNTTWKTVSCLALFLPYKAFWCFAWDSTGHAYRQPGVQRLMACLAPQATGLDAWASRVKCPARYVSHLHEICIYIYIWVVYSLCFFCCLFITVTWWYVWCIEWARGNQEEAQACLVTLWLFIISCYSLYKTTLGLLCSWFENDPHFHKYSMDFHV